MTRTFLISPPKLPDADSSYILPILGIGTFHLPGFNYLDIPSYLALSDCRGGLMLLVVGHLDSGDYGWKSFACSIREGRQTEVSSLSLIKLNRKRRDRCLILYTHHKRQIVKGTQRNARLNLKMGEPRHYPFLHKLSLLAVSLLVQKSILQRIRWSSLPKDHISDNQHIMYYDYVPSMRVAHPFVFRQRTHPSPRDSSCGSYHKRSKALPGHLNDCSSTLAGRD